MPWEDEFGLPEKIVNMDQLISAMHNLMMGIPRVYNYSVYNTEKIYELYGYAKYLIIHNAGSSDVVVSFPDSSGNYYTIPSGDNNANPLVIPGIANKKVNKLILRSNGVESEVEIVALLW